MNLRNNPSFTDVCDPANGFTPESDSVYVYGTSNEDRSYLPYDWMNRCKGVEIIQVLSQDPYAITVEHNTSQASILLRSKKQLDTLSSNGCGKTAYIDITGLSHHVWAPVLRSFMSSEYVVKVVYIEPRSYRLPTSSTEGDFYDLSQSTGGISPIPGFASLSRRQDNNIVFVPLIGFEGARLIRVIEEVDPPRDKIYPIIGVPGFQPEYPFRTYQGNKLALRQEHRWKSVLFASANCPFSIYYTLDAIAKSNLGDVLKVATIGTKPHALGAILFALLSSHHSEIIYDHPVRKAGRSEGTMRLLIYHVSALTPLKPAYA